MKVSKYQRRAIKMYCYILFVKVTKKYIQGICDSCIISMKHGLMRSDVEIYLFNLFKYQQLIYQDIE